MSREYEALITIKDFEIEMQDDIADAIQEHWTIDSEYTIRGKSYYEVTGTSFLCNGETEEEFVRRLTLSIWKANNKYCRVDVGMICLENLPIDYYTLTEDDYNKLIIKQE